MLNEDILMKKIKLTQGKVAIVDDEDFEWLSQWKWYAHGNYAQRAGASMVREILGLKKGDKRQGDHKNHDTLDNRRCNLRIVTKAQNQWNQKNPKGYSWCEHRKKYGAKIQVNGKLKRLGRFNTAKQARAAYLKAKKKYHTFGEE